MSAVIIRPRGHEALLGRLAELGASDQGASALGLPHAVMFTGPAGVGKYLAALWWSRLLKCRSKATCAPVCGDCKRLGAGSHPDVMSIQPEAPGKSVGIDEIRYLVRAMSLKSLTAGPRIAIVRDAQQLTGEAQSALLKLLEEPPGSALIVLVTENPAALIPTVRSRCQTFRFGVVGVADIVDILTTNGRDKADAERAAALALGSVGRALALSPELIADRDDLVAAVESLASENSVDIEQLVAALVERHKQGRPALEELLHWVILRIESALGYAPSAESAALSQTLAADHNAEVAPLVEHAERIQWTIDALARNANSRLAIRDLLLDLEAR